MVHWVCYCKSQDCTCHRVEPFPLEGQFLGFPKCVPEPRFSEIHKLSSSPFGQASSTVTEASKGMWCCVYTCLWNLDHAARAFTQMTLLKMNSFSPVSLLWFAIYIWIVIIPPHPGLSKWKLGIAICVISFTLFTKSGFPTSMHLISLRRNQS